MVINFYFSTLCQPSCGKGVNVKKWDFKNFDYQLSQVFFRKTFGPKMNEIRKCYIRWVYLAVLMSLKFSIKNANIDSGCLIMAIG